MTEIFDQLNSSTITQIQFIVLNHSDSILADTTISDMESINSIKYELLELKKSYGTTHRLIWNKKIHLLIASETNNKIESEIFISDHTSFTHFKLDNEKNFDSEDLYSSNGLKLVLEKYLTSI